MFRFSILGVVLIIIITSINPTMLPLHAQEDAKPEVFVTGARIPGATNGMFFNSQNQLYIANAWVGTITVLDPETGEILEVLGQAEGVSFPDDLTFAPDDTLYWTEPVLGMVGKRTPDGITTMIAQNLPNANPITLSDDGRLFIGECFGATTGIYEIDPIGVAEPRPILEDIPGCATNAMDIGPDGYLYGPRWFEKSLYRMDVETGELEVIIADFGYPAAVKFDSQGNLYAINQSPGEVARIDIDNGTYEVIAQLGPSLDNLAFDANDRLYVSSSSDSTIVEILADGSIRTVSEGGMIVSSGVAVSGDYLYSIEPQAIRWYDLATGENIGAVKTTFGITDIGLPLSVSADGTTLILSSWIDNAVKVWDTASQTVTQTYAVELPTNALRFNENLIVTRLGTASVVMLDAEGEETLVASDLQLPIGLAATKDAVWVGDWATGTIWQVIQDGEVLAEPVALATGLSFPEGMAIGADGNLLVLETGTDSVVRVDVATGEITPLASGFGGMLTMSPDLPLVPTLYFNAVTVDTDGNIYVNNDATNAIYRVAQP